jgi:protease I
VAARAPDSDSEEDAMANELQGKRVAILAADMFEQIELVEPRKALEDAGATVEIVSLEDGEIQGFDHFDPADRVAVDRTVEEASADEYDALMLPGGVGNPDQLRADENAVAFVRDFFRQRKPVAAICHAPWTLIEAGVVQGRTMTSWPSLQTDLRNAGAEWVDREVVVEDGLVLSRKPDDIPAFNRAMIEEFAEGTHARQGAHVGSEASCSQTRREGPAPSARSRPEGGGGDSNPRPPGPQPGALPTELPPPRLCVTTRRARQV